MLSNSNNSIALCLLLQSVLQLHFATAFQLLYIHATSMYVQYMVCTLSSMQHFPMFFFFFFWGGQGGQVGGGGCRGWYLIWTDFDNFG
jgi:hypothetical protein